MKKFKKTLSLVLALVLAVSSLSVAAVAFAAERDAAVEKVEQIITDFNGKVNTATPTPEDLAAYNAMVSAFAALTKAQKDSVDMFIFDKMYYNMTQRLIKVSTASSTADKYVYAYEQSLKDMDYDAPFLKDAIDLAAVLNDSKSTTAQKDEAFKNCSERGQYYYGAYYALYKGFYYEMPNYAAKALEKVIDAHVNDALKEKPFDKVKPSYASKPDPTKFPLGKDDPEYKERLKLYYEYNNYDIELNNYKAPFVLEAMETIASFAPEYKLYVDFAKKGLEAKTAFEDSKNTVKAEEAVKILDSMTATQLNVVQKAATILCSELLIKADDSCSKVNYTAKDIAVIVRDIGSYQYLAEFVQAVDAAQKPYTPIMDAIKKAYNNVPSTFISEIPTETLDKFHEIISAPASMEKPNVNDFDKTIVNYPDGATKEQVTALYGQLGELLGGLLGDLVGDLGNLDLKELLKTGVYTNGTVLQISTMLFELLATLPDTVEGFPALLKSLVMISPDKLAGTLREQKYSGAVEKLAGKKEVSDWANISFADGDMGFKDGDMEGFITALSVIFRPISFLTLILDFEDKYDGTSISTVGAYGHLISLFESLDLPDVISTAEYTKGVNEATEAMDARIRPILVPIVHFLDNLAGESDPVAALLEFVPKLAGALDSGVVNDQVNKVIAQLKMLSLDPIALDSGAIFDIIAPLLQGIEVNGATLSITLDRNNFIKLMHDLAGCGNGVVKDSVSRECAYRLGVAPDKIDTLMVLFRWLYGEITTKANRNQIKALLNTLDLAFTDKVIAMVAIELIGSINADTALELVVSFLVADPEVPVDPEKPTEKPTEKPEEETTTDLVKPGTGGEETTAPAGNGNGGANGEGVPNTGDTSIAIFAAMSIAAAAGVYLTKKKKDQE